jgi:transcriptional regulator with XRE-family HTH domain
VSLVDATPAPRTWLRRWRDRQGLTQDDAAAQVGISRNRWSEIETGSGDCTLDTALKIEALTGIAPKDWRRTDAEKGPHTNDGGPGALAATG